MPKVFYTFQQQMDKLEFEKGMIISDRKYAEQKLKRIGYYSLITGYKQPFKYLSSGKYKNGVTFEEITSFFYYDEKIRSIFLEYILHVERHIKSLMAYYFCEIYGESQEKYLDENNYNLNQKNVKDIRKMIMKLQEVVSSHSDFDCINHYVKNHNNVPLWVAMNAITFGSISKMYQYSKSNIRTKISLNFEGVLETELHQFIRLLAKCRNKCAHSDRLYTFSVREQGPDTVLHKKLCIQKRKGTYTLGKQDLFAVVIALRYLLSNDEFKVFKKELKNAIKNVLCNCPHISETQLYKYMGFPKNWNSITRYKK